MATATLTVDKQHDQQVLDAFRRWGYLQADLDPLGRLEPAPHPDLDELAGDAAEAGRRHYSGTIGVEFMHIADPDRRRWVGGSATIGGRPGDAPPSPEPPGIVGGRSGKYGPCVPGRLPK
jgi:2-oxoglutarate dehydrogenase E1 component